MKRGNDRKAEERRARYAELRESGMNKYRARLEMDVSEGTMRHYEMWYQYTFHPVPKLPRRQKGQRAIDTMDIDKL
jgi:hypothetical protein